jgi:hypothetical protein
MVHSRKAHLSGIGSALSMIAPVVVMMAYTGRWDLAVLAVVGAMSLPFYFMTRNGISLERDHPGWRRAQVATLEHFAVPRADSWRR